MSTGPLACVGGARAALVLAWIAAAMVRAKDLGSQVVVGDEWHALRVALSQDAAYIATHNFLPGEGADYSIPLALWNLLLMRTVGLEEWGMRLPVLLAGVVMVPVVSLSVWRAVGRFEGVFVAWWFAASPLFIYYSRYARPYAVVALLTLIALVGWARWWRGGGWLAGMIAACSGAVALYFSLAAGPAVACIWGFGLIFAVARRMRSGTTAAAARSAWVRWAVIVAVGGLIAAALIAPSVAAQREFVVGIGERGTPTLYGWWECAKVVFGTSDRALGCLLAATVLGTVVAFRRGPAATSIVLLMMAGQVGVCHAIRPFGIHDPGIAARYVIAAVPGVLVLACLGLCALVRWAGSMLRCPRIVVPCASVAILGAFVAEGPLPAKYSLANVSSNNLLASVSLHRERMPPFYEILATMADDATIVEWPWLPHWTDYQDIHGRRIVAVKQELQREQGFRFRSVVSTDAVLSGRGAFDYVIVHKDPVREWLLASGGRDVPDSLGSLAGGLRTGAVASLVECRRSPSLRQVHEDEWVAVFENATRR